MNVALLKKIRNQILEEPDRKGEGKPVAAITRRIQSLRIKMAKITARRIDHFIKTKE